MPSPLPFALAVGAAAAVAPAAGGTDERSRLLDFFFLGVVVAPAQQKDPGTLPSTLPYDPTLRRRSDNASKN